MVAIPGKSIFNSKLFLPGRLVSQCPKWDKSRHTLHSLFLAELLLEHTALQTLSTSPVTGSDFAWLLLIPTWEESNLQLHNRHKLPLYTLANTTCYIREYWLVQRRNRSKPTSSYCICQGYAVGVSLPGLNSHL